MSKVLLVSYENWDSMAEMPAMFKRGGYKTVDVLCSKDNWLTSNSFYDKHIKKSSDDESFKKQIVELAKNQNYDSIILVDDMVISLMNQHITSEELFKRLLPLEKIENREMLSSKAGFSRVCERNNILSPRFLVYADGYTIDEIDERMTYPILLKLDLSWSGVGIQFCSNKEELIKGLEKVNPEHRSSLVIQEYISGYEIGVEGLFHKGKLIVYNSSKILEYFESQFTFTTRRIYSRNDDIEELLITLGDSVGLNGFASISYIYDTEKKAYYLIEVDPRLNNWMPYSKYTGFDFSEGIAKILALKDTPEEVKVSHKEKDYKEIEIALFYRDLRRCWKKRDFHGLLRWALNKNGYWRFVPFYDIKLLFKMFCAMLNDLTKGKSTLPN